MAFLSFGNAVRPSTVRKGSDTFWLVLSTMQRTAIKPPKREDCFNLSQRASDELTSSSVLSFLSVPRTEVVINKSYSIRQSLRVVVGNEVLLLAFFFLFYLRTLLTTGEGETKLGPSIIQSDVVVLE